MAKRTIRPIRIEGNVAFVPLTQGYQAIIDASDADLVSRFNWQAHVCKSGVYAIRSVRGGGGRRAVMMHRAIAGDQAGIDIDHRDGNGLNNRRDNLRPATRAENVRNSKMKATNTSGFKGITLHRRTGKWQAKICADRVYHYLGLHETPEAAHAAYVAASERLHGEFGRTD